MTFEQAINGLRDAYIKQRPGLSGDNLGLTEPTIGTVSDIGGSLLKEYPGLKNSPQFAKGYDVINAAPERVEQVLKQYPGRGAEFYQPQEIGGIDMLTHPGDYNKATLELYDQKYANDPNKAKLFALGEAIHGMKYDPNFAKLRDEFYSNFSPQFITGAKTLHAQGKLGGDMAGSPGQSFEQMMNQSGTDAFIRAYFMKGDKDYTSKEWLDKLNPEQYKILNRMEKYLKTGVLK